MNLRLMMAVLVTGMTVATSSGMVLEATDDNFVRKGEPSTVQAHAGILVVKGENDGFNRKAWVAFDLTPLGLSDPSFAIESASFELVFTGTGGNVTNTTMTFEVFALTDETIATGMNRR